MDESNKFGVNDVYYVAAVLIATKISYFDVFKDVINRYKQRRSVRELRLASMSEYDAMNLFYDITGYNGMSIHIRRGNNQTPPLQVLTDILNHITWRYSERILVLDVNFLTNSEDFHSLMNNGFDVKVKESHRVPGIQIADAVAGAFRFHDGGKKGLLRIVENHISQYSKDNLNAPSVR